MRDYPPLQLSPIPTSWELDDDDTPQPFLRRRPSCDFDEGVVDGDDRDAGKQQETSFECDEDVVENDDRNSVVFGGAADEDEDAVDLQPVRHSKRKRQERSLSPDRPI